MSHTIDYCRYLNKALKTNHGTIIGFQNVPVANKVVERLKEIKRSNKLYKELRVVNVDERIFILREQVLALLDDDGLPRPEWEKSIEIDDLDFLSPDVVESIRKFL